MFQKNNYYITNYLLKYKKKKKNQKLLKQYLRKEIFK